MTEVAASSSWEAPRRQPAPARSEAMEEAMADIPVTVRAADIPRDPSQQNDMDIDMILSDAEFIMHIGNFGGDMKSYQRERNTAMKKVVSEVYSPPRVTKMISAMPQLGLTAGFAWDLTCNDPDDGEPWDFDRKCKRDKALRMLRELKRWCSSDPQSARPGAVGSASTTSTETPPMLSVTWCAHASISTLWRPSTESSWRTTAISYTNILKGQTPGKRSASRSSWRSLELAESSEINVNMELKCNLELAEENQ